MTKIIYIDRITGHQQTEQVYHGWALHCLYGDSWLTSIIRPWLLPFLTKWTWFSQLYGFLQKLPWSVRKIPSFVKKFKIDSSEFLEPVTSYSSFNDFFIRKLKPEKRPIFQDPNVAIIPADGRYYFYPNISKSSGFIVKGQKFDLATLLQDSQLAQEFEEGSMVIARLCPSDYHRFHFPCDCLPGESRVINGYLYSVNPIALRKNIQIFSQNKRTLCVLETPLFGKVLFLEIGATNVGSIQETYFPNQWQSKGNEKGYFEFGGSALILLFAKGKIKFDSDLVHATESGFEVRCLLGQSMGKKLL